MTNPCIYFVAPLPPPLHGFSWVNQSVLFLLKNHAKILVFDRTRLTVRKYSQKGLIRSIFIFYELLKFFMCFIWRMPSSIYIGLSGGFGLILDLPYFLIATIFRRIIFVHHHSFAYLNNPTIFSKICFIFLRRSQHIVLGERMRDLLINVYAVDSGNIFILSNAVFLDGFGGVDRINFGKKNQLTFGFISNITAEKGVFDFFALASSFEICFPMVNFLIAGPVAEAVRNEFDAVLLKSRNVQYVGPRYGRQKDDFYSQLDILVFPTRYVNEAEPVTIHEALRAGVPVIANKRGCIDELIDESCGHVVNIPDSFVEEAMSWSIPMLECREILVKRKLAARQKFERNHQMHSHRLRHILNCIVNGSALKISQ